TNPSRSIGAWQPATPTDELLDRGPARHEAAMRVAAIHARDALARDLGATHRRVDLDRSAAVQLADHAVMAAPALDRADRAELVVHDLDLDRARVVVAAPQLRRI